jgi:ADP-ribose pyrophosphatase
MMDPEDPSPEAAGVRELREETGYAGDNARIIGEVFPNPAIMSNTCFTVMVENCRCLHPVEFDHGEDLVTRPVPIVEIPKLISTGQIRHSLVIVGLYYFELLRQGHRRNP